MTVDELIIHLQCYDKRDDVKIQFINEACAVVEEDIDSVFTNARCIIIRGSDE